MIKYVKKLYSFPKKRRNDEIIIAEMNIKDIGVIPLITSK
tara:strand:+ start:319 stop:438 length:120 start_codon:yes stop_codon:yes gene_type:complete